MKKLIKVVFIMAFVFYLLAMGVLLFFGSRGFLSLDLSLVEYIKNSSNFVPFKTISIYVTAIVDGTMNIDIPIKNLFGNIIIFLPMGIFLPYFIKKLNKISVFITSMIMLLFVIEAIQLITRRGSFDIDDFILNMVGALVGFVIWKIKIVQKLLK